MAGATTGRTWRPPSPQAEDVSGAARVATQVGADRDGWSFRCAVVAGRPAAVDPPPAFWEEHNRRATSCAERRPPWGMTDRQRVSCGVAGRIDNACVFRPHAGPCLVT